MLQAIRCAVVEQGRGPRLFHSGLFSRVKMICRSRLGRRGPERALRLIMVSPSLAWGKADGTDPLQRSLAQVTVCLLARKDWKRARALLSLVEDSGQRCFTLGLFGA